MDELIRSFIELQQNLIMYSLLLLTTTNEQESKVKEGW